jgi:hypothetical protein
VGGEKEAILRVGATFSGQLEEAADGVHFAVPERVFGLVVGLADDEGEVGLPQDRSAKDLVPLRADAFAAERGEIVLDDVEQAVEELNCIHQWRNTMRVLPVAS